MATNPLDTRPVQALPACVDCGGDNLTPFPRYVLEYINRRYVTYSSAAGDVNHKRVMCGFTRCCYCCAAEVVFERDHYAPRESVATSVLVEQSRQLRFEIAALQELECLAR